MITTAPSVKPSAQSRLVLEAMATEAKQGEARWDKMMVMMERLTGKVDAMEKVHHQLLGQSELTADLVKQAADERTILSRRVEENGKALARMRLEAMAREMEDVGTGPESSDTGGRRGAIPNQDQGGRELQQHVPKMLFPKFGGKEPAIWLNRCEDYFNMYQVPGAMKVPAASMNMEGNAARWLQILKLRGDLGDWPNFSRIVLQKFGVDEYPKAMERMLHLQQKGGVEEYVEEFEEARYATAVHNPELGEVFFVAQFMKGLKNEIQGPVKSQIPTTVDRAIRLALVQQEILVKNSGRNSKIGQGGRGVTGVRTEGKVGDQGVWSKERQVKEYRRINGLCYTCGEKFEPGHQAKCPKRVIPQLNVLTTEDLEMVLSEEQLGQIEKEEVQEEENHRLSIHALSGADSSQCIRFRALIQNQLNPYREVME